MKNKIQDIITYLSKINNEYVVIQTQHKLFGNQTIKCALHVVNDNERIGFSIKGQSIYINKSDICNILICNEFCKFEDNFMSIQICYTNS